MRKRVHGAEMGLEKYPKEGQGVQGGDTWRWMGGDPREGVDTQGGDGGTCGPWWEIREEWG